MPALMMKRGGNSNKLVLNKSICQNLLLISRCMVQRSARETLTLKTRVRLPVRPAKKKCNFDVDLSATGLAVVAQLEERRRHVLEGARSHPARCRCHDNRFFLI